MSGIARVSEKMKKKISFGDYSPVPVEEKSTSRKIYTLPSENTSMLQAIYSKRLGTANECSISEIMSEAIHLLYKQEI